MKKLLQKLDCIAGFKKNRGEGKGEGDGGDKTSLKKTVKRLRKYEAASGQRVNMDKSSFYIHHKVDLHRERRIRKITNMRKGSFPFIYLGCPVFYGRRKSIYYADLVKKEAEINIGWHGIMCLPKEEGGIDFRSLHDISNALFAKLWWSFRTSNSLWSVYMWNKYCKKLHLVIAQARGGSNAWKKMVLVREQVEHNIWWQMKNGSSSFWFENWTKLGALYYVITESNFDAEVEVKEYVAGDRWNLERLYEVLPEEVVNHIQQHIKVPLELEGDDKAWWQLTKNGLFTVKSAWDYMRQREEKREVFNFIWEKGVPIKISFNMEGRHLHQAILTWWIADVSTKLQAIFRAVPATVMWELWKMRNAVNMGITSHIAG
ncbi:uncharacterized protein LOC132624223 [Lycium barbarum]|uniref:uncharacterized protein LOC132624223 n=1 Tax=Lycium barbarum TaxID=112863 RepID=UPI00293E1245|nr:uncharacterized protein LOC132624223 [Lycium barbarum]